MKIKGYVLGGPWNKLLRGEKVSFTVEPKDGLNMIPITIDIPTPKGYRIKKILRKLDLI